MSEIECAMNPDLPTSWVSNRWKYATLSRNGSHRGSTSSCVQESPQQPGPQPSGSNAANLMSQKPTLETSVLDSWIGKSRPMSSTRVRDSPRLTEPYDAATEASTYPLPSQQRHGSNYGPQQLADTLPRDTSTGTWRSLQHNDRHESSNHTTDAPLLTLQIPQPLDLQRSSTLNTPLPPNGRFHGSNSNGPAGSTHLTSLPSFAALRDQPDRFDNAEGSKKNTSMLPLYRLQEQGPAPSLLSRNFSPPKSLKRPAEPLDREQSQALKRPQSGTAIEQAYQLARRGSNDYGSREPRLEHSPPPTESIFGSAHPRLSSPSFGRGSNYRTLPSPSTLGYQTSAAPSLPLNTAQSATSPATSYQPPSTTHTTSSSSATSQHIADLQHQVTLKSLALQTLQSEYASLLQKLQRERVKSQTIEKKTSAADQEVNDLTSKNEDLTEQIKTLETQLEESERKREDQRQEAARDKEQWGRMLEMSGRLQNRADAERQRLLEENNHLTRRLTNHERGVEQRPGEQANRNASQSESSRVDCHSSGPEWQSISAHRAVFTMPTAPPDKGERPSLEQEVVSLRARVKVLRVTLEGVRQHNEEIEATTRAFLEHNGLLWSNVSRALGDDYSQQTRTEAANREAPIGRSNTQTQQTSESAQKPEPFRSPLSTRQAGTLEIIKDGKRSIANIAEVARPKAAGPQELGFHVPTTTSSPEELIKALGPVPTSQASFHHSAPTTSGWTPITPSSQTDNTAEPVSAFAPNFPTKYIGHHRPVESSPRSYHGSNAEGNDDALISSPGTGRRSPDTYNSEPAPSTTRPTASQSIFTPQRPMLKAYHSHSFHGHTKSTEWMPPPPRPEVSYAVTTGTRV